MNRQLLFSEKQWDIKKSNEKEGPGNNYFGLHHRNVTIDKKGHLHLRSFYRKSHWYCAEVINKEYTGYGIYEFYIENRLNNFNHGSVLGLFLYNEDYDPYFNEIDIEVSKWCEPNNKNTQYVVQDHPHRPTKHRFVTPEKCKFTVHRIEFRADTIHFRSFCCTNQSFNDPVEYAAMSYKTNNILLTEAVKIRMNLWTVQDCIQPKHKQHVTIHKVVHLQSFNK